MDPSLANQIRGGAGTDGRLLEKYLLTLREGYLTYMQSDQQVVPHIKELWNYMAWHYDREVQNSREMKNLRKARTWGEFSAAQHILLKQW